jgi:hypothetical protein
LRFSPDGYARLAALFAPAFRRVKHGRIAQPCVARSGQGAANATVFGVFLEAACRILRSRSTIA